MFSLKLDVLLVSLERAATALLSIDRGRSADRPDLDPREVKRIEDELRLAREQVRLQVTRGRLLW